MYFTDFSRHRDGTGKAYDFALMKELEETRKVVQEAKRAFQSNRGSGTIVLTVNTNLPLLFLDSCDRLKVLLFTGSKVVGTIFILIFSLLTSI